MGERILFGKVTNVKQAACTGKISSMPIIFSPINAATSAKTKAKAATAKATYVMALTWGWALPIYSFAFLPYNWIFFLISGEYMLKPKKENVNSY